MGPRSYVERIYNVQQWTEMPAGGHFAALEQPDLLIKDIRKFERLYEYRRVYKKSPKAELHLHMKEH